MYQLNSIQTLLTICALIFGAAALVYVIAKSIKTKGQVEEEQKQKQLAQNALRKAVERGSHDEQGYPLCKTCGDKHDPSTRATEHGFRIESEDGIVAWIRQRVGAPARLRVGRRRYDDFMYCRECARLCGSYLQSYLLDFEKLRRDQVRDGDIELRRVERVGMDESVKALIKQHDDKIRREQRGRPAEVVPLGRAGSG